LNFPKINCFCGGGVGGGGVDGGGDGLGGGEDDIDILGLVL